MDLVGMAGVSRQAAVGVVVAAIGVVLVFARVLARRGSRRERTLVDLNSRD